MSQFTCGFDELDDDTRVYLRKVRDLRGEKTPGVFVPGTTGSAHWVALLAGPIILVGFVAQGFLSGKDAWAAAMIQTAGVMLGGWLTLFGVRRILGLNGAAHVGTFTYFDPTHAYAAAGETVTVTDVSDFRGVEVKHRFGGNGYGGSNVVFDVAGRKLLVPVFGKVRADTVGDYYRSLVEIEDAADPAWANVSPAELGGAAKLFAAEEQMPRDAAAVNLDVTTLPADPRRANRAGFGVSRYLAILAVGGVVYLGFWQAHDPLRDEQAFADATGAGAGAAGLRGYLIDERNTRHRDEAKQQLAALYDAGVGRAVASAKDPAVRDWLGGVLQSLKAAPQPVVSIRVEEQAAAGGDGPQFAGVTRQLRTDIADGLGTVVGKELIAFVAAPDGEVAHCELLLRTTPTVEKGAGIPAYTVTWQLRMRVALTDAPVELPPATLPKAYMASETANLTADLKAAVWAAAFDGPPPTIPPPPVFTDFD